MGKVVIAYADYQSELATSHFRCYTPAAALSRIGHQVKLVHIDALRDSLVEPGITIMAERTLSPDIVRKFKKYNCRVVFTFDDAYSRLPQYASVREYWRAHGGLDMFYETIKLTDINITPSDELCKLYRAKTNVPFETVPNYMRRERWDILNTDEARSEIASRKRGRIVIGGGFSAYHIESFVLSGISDALRAISNKYGNQVEIRLYGARDVFGSLDIRGIPYNHCSYVHWSRWPVEMASMDIAIAPLGGDYDRYRSRLRLDEAGLSGIPYVASNYQAYTDCGAGGILVENEAGKWYRALCKLIDDEQLRREMGESGREWASGHFIDNNIEHYERILWLE